MPLAAPLWFCSLLLAAPQEPVEPPPPPPPPETTTKQIVWQRNLADALAAQQASGLPLLIVVNQDGEAFNDRFATKVYQDPEFVALTEGYVCVIASPVQHNQADHDENGNRIDCPRFPGCTCSEHITIEPELYKRWFKEQRVAPRHLAVAADGTVLFDRFLDSSMQRAIDEIRKHKGTPKAGYCPTDDLGELFRRRDAASRLRLELRLQKGDAAERARVLTAAADATNAPIDLLRPVLRTGSPSEMVLAVEALARIGDAAVLPEIENVLARTDHAQSVQLLVASLTKLGAGNPLAARLAQHFALDTNTPLAKPWTNAWSPPAADAEDREQIEALLNRCDAALRERADDHAMRLQQAIGNLMLARVLLRDGKRGADLWLEETANAAGKVLAGQEADDGLRAEAAAVATVAAWLRGDGKAAANFAVQALGTVQNQRQPDAWLARQFAETLVPLTAQLAYGIAQENPNASLRPQLERLVAAEAMLDQHGGASEATALAAIACYEFAGLRLRARQRAGVLIQRFPGSAQAHQYWRNREFVDLGPERLRADYARFLASTADRATASWFVGYAEVVIAESRVTAKDGPGARTAYDAAIAQFTACADGNPDYADNANHFRVLALAGRAVTKLEADDGEGAVEDLLQAAALRPASLGDKDGLGRDPKGLMLRVARTLKTKGEKELAARLDPLLQ